MSCHAQLEITIDNFTGMDLSINQVLKKSNDVQDETEITTTTTASANTSIPPPNYRGRARSSANISTQGPAAAPSPIYTSLQQVTNFFSAIDQKYAVFAPFSVLNFTRLTIDAIAPTKGSIWSAGFDLYAPFDFLLTGNIIFLL